MPSHVKNRDVFLKDGDNIKWNDKLQSDMVSIFLNLSAIPDDIIHNLRVDDTDYSLNFNEQMDNYLSKNPDKEFRKMTAYKQYYSLYMDFLAKKDNTDNAEIKNIRNSK